VDSGGPLLLVWRHGQEANASNGEIHGGVLMPGAFALASEVPLYTKHALSPDGPSLVYLPAIGKTAPRALVTSSESAAIRGLITDGMLAPLSTEMAFPFADQPPPPYRGEGVGVTDNYSGAPQKADGTIGTISGSSAADFYRATPPAPAAVSPTGLALIAYT